MSENQELKSEAQESKSDNQTPVLDARIQNLISDYVEAKAKEFIAGEKLFITKMVGKLGDPADKTIFDITLHIVSLYKITPQLCDLLAEIYNVNHVSCTDGYSGTRYIKFGPKKITNEEKKAKLQAEIEKLQKEMDAL